MTEPTDKLPQLRCAACGYTDRGEIRPCPRCCPSPTSTSEGAISVATVHEAITDIIDEMYAQSRLPGQDRAECKVAIGALGRLRARVKALTVSRTLDADTTPSLRSQLSAAEARLAAVERERDEAREIEDATEREADHKHELFLEVCDQRDEARTERDALKKLLGDVVTAERRMHDGGVGDVLEAEAALFNAIDAAGKHLKEKPDANS